MKIDFPNVPSRRRAAASARWMWTTRAMGLLAFAFLFAGHAAEEVSATPPSETQTESSATASAPAVDPSGDGAASDTKRQVRREVLEQAAVAHAFESVMKENWAGRLVRLPVHGPIANLGMLPIPASIPDLGQRSMVGDLRAAIAKANDDGAKALLVEINSPGGVVGECIELAQALLKSKVPTSAMVVDQAISGGAMVALACKEIVLCRGATFGDIQPMQYRMNGLQPEYVEMSPAEREKAEAVLRATLRESAKAGGRPAALVDAMVSSGIEVYRVTYDDGRQEYLDKPSFELQQTEIAAGREKRVVTENRIVSPAGHILTLDTDQALEFGIADALFDTPADFLAAWAERHGEKAEAILSVPIVKGMTSFEMPDLKDLFPSLDLPGWVKMALFVFLVMGIAGLMVEWNMPGFGVPGVCSIIGWVGFFSILMMHDRGSWLAVFLFIVGVALLVVEIAVLPGFGVAGISGIACVLVGLFLAYAPPLDGMGLEWFAVPVGDNVTVFRRLAEELAVLLLLATVGGGLVTWGFVAMGPHIPFLSPLFMRKVAEIGDTPIFDVGESEVERAAEEARRRAWVGSAGTAETPLRPAGKVRLASGERLDVVADGLFLDAGTAVRVLAVDDNRILVGLPDADA